MTARRGWIGGWNGGWIGGMVAAALGATCWWAGPASAAEGQPAMCQGRTDASTTLIAHANGEPKMILNLETDAAGLPTGALILGRGGDRVYAETFCRLWRHLPGQEPDGAGEAVDESATTAHAVGVGTLRDGTRVLVRADVRETEEGAFFRVRYRAMGQHGGEDEGSAGHDAGGHDETDENWTRVPVEGWLRLDRLMLR